MEIMVGDKELVRKLIQKNYFTDKINFYSNHIRVDGLSIIDEKKIRKLKRIAKNYFGERVTYYILYTCDDGLIICLERAETKIFIIKILTVQAAICYFYFFKRVLLFIEINTITIWCATKVRTRIGEYQ